MFSRFPQAITCNNVLSSEFIRIFQQINVLLCLKKERKSFIDTKLCSSSFVILSLSDAVVRFSQRTFPQLLPKYNILTLLQPRSIEDESESMLLSISSIARNKFEFDGTKLL